METHPKQSRGLSSLHREDDMDFPLFPYISPPGVPAAPGENVLDTVLPLIIAAVTL